MANTFLAFSQNPREAVFFCHWKDDCVYANTKAYIRWKEYILAGVGFIYINLFLVRKLCSRINFSWKDKIFGLCEFQFNNFKGIILFKKLIYKSFVYKRHFNWTFSTNYVKVLTNHENFRYIHYNFNFCFKSLLSKVLTKVYRL